MQLEEALHKAKNEITLNPEKKASIRADLMRIVEADLELQKSTAAGVRQVGFDRHSMRRSNFIQIFFQKHKTMPILAAILMLALAGGGTSLAAQGSLPGDLLYPVKVHVNENVEAALQVSPQAQAAFEAHLAQTRLDEAAQLAAQGHIDAEAKSELEHSFEAHANKAQEHIARLQATGNVTAAADVASRLESSLNAEQQILGSIDEKNNEGVAIAAGPLRTKVGSELKDVAKVRTDLEAGIQSKGSAKVKIAAESKINTAAQSIETALAFVSFQKAKLGVDATAQANAKLDEAINLEAQAKVKIAAGAYGEAFALANRANRTSQEARLLAEAKVNLGVNIGIAAFLGHNDTASSSVTHQNNSRDKKNNGGLQFQDNSVIRIGEPNREPDNHDIPEGAGYNPLSVQQKTEVKAGAQVETAPIQVNVNGEVQERGVIKIGL